MVKDIIGGVFITAFAIVFCTNAVTDQYNMWALMARYLGAN